MRFLSAPSRPLRYLADASYWMYIAHLPLVMALQTAWMGLGAPWWLKFAAVVLATCALLLWSYLTSIAFFLGVAFCAQLESVRAGVHQPAAADPELVRV